MGPRALFEDSGDDMGVDKLTAQIEREAWFLAAQARNVGLVLTVEQVSQKPLASGNHVDVVTVRPVRKPDSTY